VAASTGLTIVLSPPGAGAFCDLRGMWRRTYERHCAALARIEGNLFV
jgi:hypothetical protein